ncbi:MAG: MFS transporter [Actinocatenispora sp.]
MPNKLTLILLGLGAFAVGTDGFIISGILPRVAHSLTVSTATAGQLVTIFTVVYAVTAPILAAVTARLPRRALLAGAMTVFVVANIVGAAAGTYWLMVVARVLAALGAAAFIGPAVAVATGVVPAEYRGRAYAYVAGGLSVATALGLPLGTLVGAVAGWRVTLVLVAAIAAVAVVGLSVAMPTVPQPPSLSLAERVRVVTRPSVLTAMGGNLFVAAAVYGLFTYIAPLTTAMTPISGAGLTIVLLAWGAVALVANPLGGRWNDSYGPHRVYLVMAVALCAVLAAFGVLAALGPADGMLTAVIFVLLVAALSAVAWGLQPAQANRIMAFAPQAAPVAVSFGNSATYVGISAGSALGGVVVSHGSVTGVSWMGLGSGLVAVVFILLARRQVPATEQPQLAAAGETAKS